MPEPRWISERRCFPFWRNPEDNQRTSSFKDAEEFPGWVKTRRWGEQQQVVEGKGEEKGGHIQIAGSVIDPLQFDFSSFKKTQPNARSYHSRNLNTLPRGALDFALHSYQAGNPFGHLIDQTVDYSTTSDEYGIHAKHPRQVYEHGVNSRGGSEADARASASKRKSSSGLY